MKKLIVALAVLSLSFTGFAQDGQEKSTTPSGVLEKEHDVTLLVLAEAEQTAAGLEKGSVPRERIEKMIDFFSNFVDRCHHAKEERLFFDELVSVSKQKAGLIKELKNEHVLGRVYITAMRSSLPKAADGDEQSIGILSMSLKQYAGLIRGHIGKENNMLFTGTGETLSDQTQQKLMQGFQRIEHVELGEGFHEKYHGIAMELTGKQK